MNLDDIVADPKRHKIFDTILEEACASGVISLERHANAPVEKDLHDFSSMCLK